MKESLWNGFKRIDFEFEGREATLVFPNEANENKNWLFKTEYFHAFVDFEAAMVGKGWHDERCLGSFLCQNLVF